MFSHLFRAAQASVDNAVGQVAETVAVAIPLVVAVGFGTAALFMRLEREHGAETASLIVAGIYGATGFVCLLALMAKRRRPSSMASTSSQEALLSDVPQHEQNVHAELSASDKELLAAAATTVLPLALPAILRLITKNLPVFLAIAAAVLVFMRRETGVGSGEAAADGQSANA